MNEIVEGIIQAFQLILSLDPEIIEITVRTLTVSISATIIASIISVPTGGLLHFSEFRGRRFLINIIQTLYSVPTVLVGLLLFLLISKSGPFGSFSLLFTPIGMVIAQVILIVPLLVGLTLNALSGLDRNLRDTLYALGATPVQMFLVVIKEARFAIIGAIILGFGRAISEVGAAMMIGGNIRGYTRVLTTTIALETSMGNISLSIALGIILLFISLIVTLLVNIIQER